MTKKRILTLILVLVLIASVGMMAFACNNNSTGGGRCTGCNKTKCDKSTPKCPGYTEPVDYIELQNWVETLVESLDKTVDAAIRAGLDSQKKGGKLYAGATFYLDLVADAAKGEKVEMELVAKGRFDAVNPGNSEAFVSVNLGSTIEGLQDVGISATKSPHFTLYAKDGDAWIGQKLLSGATMQWSKLSQGKGKSPAENVYSLAYALSNVPSALGGLLPEDDAEEGIFDAPFSGISDLYVAENIPMLKSISNLVTLIGPLMSWASEIDEFGEEIEGDPFVFAPKGYNGNNSPAGLYTWNIALSQIAGLLEIVEGLFAGDDGDDDGGGLLGLLEGLVGDISMLDPIIEAIFNVGLEDFLAGKGADKFPSLLVNYTLDTKGHITGLNFVYDNMKEKDIRLEIGIKNLEFSSDTSTTAHPAFLAPSVYQNAQETAIKLSFNLSTPSREFDMLVNAYVYPSFVINYCSEDGVSISIAEGLLAEAELILNGESFGIDAVYYINGTTGYLAFDLANVFEEIGVEAEHDIPTKFMWEADIRNLFSFVEGYTAPETVAPVACEECDKTACECPCAKCDTEPCTCKKFVSWETVYVRCEECAECIKTTPGNCLKPVAKEVFNWVPELNKTNTIDKVADAVKDIINGFIKDGFSMGIITDVFDLLDDIMDIGNAIGDIFNDKVITDNGLSFLNFLTGLVSIPMANESALLEHILGGKLSTLVEACGDCEGCEDDEDCLAPVLKDNAVVDFIIRIVAEYSNIEQPERFTYEELLSMIYHVFELEVDLLNADALYIGGYAYNRGLILIGTGMEMGDAVKFSGQTMSGAGAGIILQLTCANVAPNFQGGCDGEDEECERCGGTGFFTAMTAGVGFDIVAKNKGTVKPAFNVGNLADFVNLGDPEGFDIFTQALLDAFKVFNNNYTFPEVA
ncbi:MAG: hypothetical protein FWD49_00025 [Firmicutes bacterium]|nr:hypothetical protein [Bacillota bacterium]